MKNNIEQVFSSKLDELKTILKSNSTKFESEELLAIAEKILKENKIISNELWFRFLDLTKSPIFLTNLKSREMQYRWAESAFKIIRLSNYSLLDMINQRVQSHPEKILFSVFDGNVRNDYSYKLVRDKIKKIAASFYNSESSPQVAIYMDNSIDGALCDIACLSYDIFVSPLHIHFGLENLKHIFNLLKFNFVITDSVQRIELLKRVSDEINFPLK